MDRADLPCDQTLHEARFDVSQFIAIAESGALARFAKSELIDGRIVVVNAQSVWHMRAKGAIFLALSAGVMQHHPSL